LGVNPSHSSNLGMQVGSAGVSATSALPNNHASIATGASASNTTASAIFQRGDWDVFLRTLQQNSILRALAEPILITMNGQQASVSAGGEFPVLVPQVGTSGVAPPITAQFKEYGIRLTFLPHILDGNLIRLTVDAEVNNIDRALSTRLVA